MSDDNAGICFVVVGVVVVVLTSFTAMIAQSTTTQNMKEEAVKHHAGRWEADEKGKVIFLWNDETNGNIGIKKAEKP